MTPHARAGTARANILLRAGRSRISRVQFKFQTAEVLENTHLLIKLRFKGNGENGMNVFCHRSHYGCISQTVRFCGILQLYLERIFALKRLSGGRPLRALPAVAVIYQPALRCFS